MPRNIYVVPGLWMILLHVRLENFQFLNLNSEKQVFRISPISSSWSLPLVAKFFIRKKRNYFCIFAHIWTQISNMIKKKNIHQYGDSKKIYKMRRIEKSPKQKHQNGKKISVWKMKPKKMLNLWKNCIIKTITILNWFCNFFWAYLLVLPVLPTHISVISLIWMLSTCTERSRRRLREETKRRNRRDL